MKPVMHNLIFPILLVLVASLAHAAGGKVTDPNGTAPDRYVYYPGTEDLAKDEIRLFACGTGLPAARSTSVPGPWSTWPR